MEVLNFLRDNSIHNITEAETYYVVKFFDSDEDGKLNYPDFMQLVLPCDNAHLRARATQRPNQYITRNDFLTIDVERDITNLLLAEIELHNKSEKLKQELESQPDFSGEAVFRAIDDWGYGFVDQSNIKGFLRNFKHVASDEECVAIVRRLDLDGDAKLNMDEFVMGVLAQEPFSKMIIRDKQAKAEEKARIKKQNKIDEKKGKRVNKKLETEDPEDALAVAGLDRSYQNILSTSPLKYRPNYDLYGSPEKKEESKGGKENKSEMKS